MFVCVFNIDVVVIYVIGDMMVFVFFELGVNEFIVRGMDDEVESWIFMFIFLFKKFYFIWVE